MTEAIRQGDIPGVQLRRRQVLAVPPGEAWLWLTEAERLASWLADQVEVEGEEIRLTGPAGKERVRILESGPPSHRILSLEKLDSGWSAATRLTVRIHALPSGGSEVDVLQDGFQRLPLSRGLTIWEDYRRRWRDALARLAEIALPIA